MAVANGWWCPSRRRLVPAALRYRGCCLSVCSSPRGAASPRHVRGRDAGARGGIQGVRRGGPPRTPALPSLLHPASSRLPCRCLGGGATQCTGGRAGGGRVAVEALPVGCCPYIRAGGAIGVRQRPAGRPGVVCGVRGRRVTRNTSLSLAPRAVPVPLRHARAAAHAQPLELCARRRRRSVTCVPGRCRVERGW